MTIVFVYTYIYSLFFFNLVVLLFKPLTWSIIPVHRHLRSPGQSQAYLRHLTVTIKEHNEGWSRADNFARESFWIRKIKTVSPEVINEKNIDWVPTITLVQNAYSFKKLIHPPKHQYRRKFTRVLIRDNLYNNNKDYQMSR